MLQKLFPLLILALLPILKAKAQGHPQGEKMAADTINVKPAMLTMSLKPSAIKYNYYQSLGAACKIEWKFEQKTKVPLRVRLGSLQQTDYMEQKPNAQRP